jgi:hypothetical protein
MKPEVTNEVESLLDVRVLVPQHVVYRSFPSETVMLNLQTGRYHGLNPTAGEMLDAITRASSVRAAAADAADSYEQPESVIQHDMCELCRVMLERGLVEVSAEDEA